MWKEQTVIQERMKLMAEYLGGDCGVSELAGKYGVSRKTVYKWIERYGKEGIDGLKDRSRAPHHHPQAVSQEVEGRILEWKAKKPGWGAPKLRVKLIRELGDKVCPAESTISEILRRHGLSRRKARRARGAVPSQQPFGMCVGANQVWCADFKGYFFTGNGRKCSPLTITDAHSRYLLCCQGLEGNRFLTVRPLFIETFREYGMPWNIRTDNGAPFGSSGLGGLTLLSVGWVRLGIGLERIEPGHPEQNGQHERMHRTLKEETAKPPARNLKAQQESFERFGHEYNYERPHEALGQKTPSEFYERSPREYPERLPEQRGYPDEWVKRTVKASGQVKWKGKSIHTNCALAGQEVGFKPIEEGKWEVYFEEVCLGLFDQKKGRIKGYRRLRMDDNRKEEG